MLCVALKPEIRSGDFAEGVKPLTDEVVVLKQFSSAFFGTSLSSLLTGMGCDGTILCGYSTSGCVRATGEFLLLQMLTRENFSADGI